VRKISPPPGFDPRAAQIVASYGRDKMLPKFLFMKTNEGSAQKITDRFPKTGREVSHLFQSLLERASNLAKKLLSKKSVSESKFCNWVL
jgi:hypothetical protein